MDDYELLLRHTAAWARDKKIPMDRDLLETAINLRSFHDVTAAQEWPVGSAEHLMLVRWPSHGPAEEPDVDALIDTLETFWRFLRSTGRMRSGSADPKALVKEARRAAPRMREACADTDRHSTGKSLMRFANEAGLSLDDAETEEEVNQRLQQVMEAFNNLPFEERDRWLPSPGAPGAAATPRMTELLQEALGDDPFGELGDFDEYDEDDDWGEGGYAEETWELLPAEGEFVAQPPRSVTAQEVQDSSFARQCLALARWVGEGKPVTATGVLRLATAREAYLELGLWDWEVQAQRWVPERVAIASADLPAADQLAQRDVMLADLRSAVTAKALQRLWVACEAAGLIEIGKTKARATDLADPDRIWTDDEWVTFSLMAIVAMIDAEVGYEQGDPVLRALLTFIHKDVNQVAESEVRDWWWAHPDNLLGGFSGEEDAIFRGFSDLEVGRQLWALEDTGAWRREGETLHRTGLGTELAVLLMSLMDMGILGR